MSVLAHGFILLREHSLAVDGGHAEKRGQPHPENRARAAGVQRGCAAGDVARADLRSDRGGQRLKGAHALLTGLIALERKTTKQTAPANRVRMVKMMPVPTSKYSRMLFHTMPLILSTTAAS